MPRIVLSHGQRLEIARQRQSGVAAQVLAKQFGVSRQTIHAVVRQLKGAPNVDGGSTRSFSVRTTERELRRFDAAVGRYDLTRAEAIRRLMLAVGDVFVADEGEAEGVRRLGVALHKIGTNVNQIARACNEARLKGLPITYTGQTHAELREALALTFEVADQVRQVADGKRKTIQMAVTATLQGGSRGTP